MKAGQTPELLSMPWPEATHQFVEHAMNCYSAACSGKEWFFQLDLSTAVVAGLWEIVRQNSASPQATFPELEKRAVAEYEDMMDKILLDRALWDTAKVVFGEGVAIVKKVVKNLKGTRESVLSE